MQVDLTAVLGFFGSCVGVAVGIYLAILRYTVGQKEKEIDRRFLEMATKFVDADKKIDEGAKTATAEHTKLKDRVAEDEKVTVAIQGELKLVTNNHQALTGDMEEIKRNMITKAEFEPRMTNLERTLNQILAELRGGRYSSQDRIPAQNPIPGRPPSKG